MGWNSFLAGAAVLLALCLASATALGLLALRMFRTSDPHFAFLAWNLLLAWVPLGLALLLFAAHRAQAPGITLALPFAGWLLFLPNAPYLLTDFIHLAPDSRVPLWFDFALIAAFAGAGLLVGFVSVYLVQRVIRERLGTTLSWTVVFAVFVLSGVGVYIGRVLRLNSWDALQEPGEFASLVLLRLEDPLGNLTLLTTVFVFTCFLTAAYVALYTSANALRRTYRFPHNSHRSRSRDFV